MISCLALRIPYKKMSKESTKDLNNEHVINQTFHIQVHLIQSLHCNIIRMTLVHSISKTKCPKIILFFTY